jgi:hypothetical protein
VRLGLVEGGREGFVIGFRGECKGGGGRGVREFELIVCFSCVFGIWFGDVGFGCGCGWDVMCERAVDVSREVVTNWRGNEMIRVYVEVKGAKGRY